MIRENYGGRLLGTGPFTITVLCGQERWTYASTIVPARGDRLALPGDDARYDVTRYVVVDEVTHEVEAVRLPDLQGQTFAGRMVSEQVGVRLVCRRDER